VQLLKAGGCRVIGLDIDRSNLELAEQLGCDKCVFSNHEAIRHIEAFSRGHGADAVLVTAATKSNTPVELAMRVARKKAKIVIVGAVGMNLPREAFYEKELDVRISCSYGPGRYDPSYEENGVDYPIGYVRWTENRNMQAVLDLMAQKKLDVKSLITHRFPVEESLGAYDLITGRLREKSLAIIIEYPAYNEISGNGKAHDERVARNSIGERFSHNGEEPIIGFVGAGNFAQAQLLPPLKKMGVRLRVVANARSVSAKSIAQKHRFELCTTEARDVLDDLEVNVVFIATRHDLHAELAISALQKGKAVFVEKPLAVSWPQLEEIRQARQHAEAPLMVGFNRRFAPLVREAKTLFAGRTEPLAMIYRVSAGFLPPTHWYHDREQGGGRIIGEACHFIDLLSFFAGSPVQSVFAEGMENAGLYHDDNVIITLRFGNGSVGTVIYTANGDAGLPKERLEIFCQGTTAVLDDFRLLEIYKDRRRRVIKNRRQDKGHGAALRHFIEAVQNGSDLSASAMESLESTAATLAACDSLRTRTPFCRAWPRWEARAPLIEHV
jgi:polar amino acid transport system substrate-binding protein